MLRKIKARQSVKSAKCGATGTSYGLAVGLIAIVAVLAVTGAGQSIKTLMGGVASRMDSVSNGTIGAETEPSPDTTFASCADLLAANPSTTSGTYTIDPDGTGPISPFQTQCDMDNDDGTGAGWTLYFASDASFTGLTLRDSESDWVFNTFSGNGAEFITCGSFGRLLVTDGDGGYDNYPSAPYAEITLSQAHSGMSEIRGEVNFGQHSDTEGQFVVDGTPSTFGPTTGFDMLVVSGSAGAVFSLSEYYLWNSTNNVQDECGGSDIVQGLRSLWIR